MSNHGTMPAARADFYRLISHGFQGREGVRHEVLRNMEFLEHLGLEPVDSKLELWTREEDLDRLTEVLFTSGNRSGAVRSGRAGRRGAEEDMADRELLRPRATARRTAWVCRSLSWETRRSGRWVSRWRQSTGTMSSMSMWALDSEVIGGAARSMRFVRGERLRSEAHRSRTGRPDCGDLFASRDCAGKSRQVTGKVRTVGCLPQGMQAAEYRYHRVRKPAPRSKLIASGPCRWLTS